LSSSQLYIYNCSYLINCEYKFLYLQKEKLSAMEITRFRAGRYNKQYGYSSWWHQVPGNVGQQSPWGPALRAPHVWPLAPAQPGAAISV
jgi:hypothetical protein